MSKKTKKIVILTEVELRKTISRLACEIIEKVKNIDNLFDWIKGAEIIELKKCNTSEDPVRPELDNKFRTSYGRKIYGVKYKGEIHAVMCFAFTNEIPKSVEELVQKLKNEAKVI